MLLRRVITILALLLVAQLAIAENLSGRVVAISDGDSFTLLTADKTQVKIRLAEIDAPESGHWADRMVKGR